MLPTKIEQVIQTQLKEVLSFLASGLDTRKINESINEQMTASAASVMSGGNFGGASSGGSNSSTKLAGSVLPGFRTQLWANVENILDLIFTKSCELMQLQKVLCKKRDPSLGITFAELLLPQERGREMDTTVSDKTNRLQVLSYFWSESLKMIKNSLVKGSVSSSSIRQTFEGEFPKLVRLFNDLWQRLCGAANACLETDHSLTLSNPFHSASSNEIRDILTDFERLVLSLRIWLCPRYLDNTVLLCT